MSTVNIYMSTVNMNKEQQAAARSLAVSYAAYNNAVVASVNNSIIVWGEALRIAQKETGIELHYSRVIIRMITKARQAERAARRATARSLAVTYSAYNKA
tara:strand:- start:822 stop:1121 length:300 start_codon:yes stop_codon:yes gene_type:complete